MKIKAYKVIKTVMHADGIARRWYVGTYATKEAAAAIITYFTECGIAAAIYPIY